MYNCWRFPAQNLGCNEYGQYDIFQTHNSKKIWRFNEVKPLNLLWVRQWSSLYLFGDLRSRVTESVVSCVKWIEAPTPIEIRFGALRCILTSKFDSLWEYFRGTIFFYFGPEKWYGITHWGWKSSRLQPQKVVRRWLCLPWVRHYVRMSRRAKRNMQDVREKLTKLVTAHRSLETSEWETNSVNYIANQTAVLAVNNREWGLRDRLTRD